MVESEAADGERIWYTFIFDAIAVNCVSVEMHSELYTASMKSGVEQHWFSNSVRASNKRKAL